MLVVEIGIGLLPRRGYSRTVSAVGSSGRVAVPKSWLPSRRTTTMRSWSWQAAWIWAWMLPAGSAGVVDGIGAGSGRVGNEGVLKGYIGAPFVRLMASRQEATCRGMGCAEPQL